MLSAYYMTVLGALVWLLMRHSVDRCEARADKRLICYLTRNSEEFLAHLTLVAAAFALASIFVLIGIGSGISTDAFLSPIEAFLIQTQHWTEGAGLSVWSTSAILIGVFLVHLIRLPEDVEFPHFPSALRFIRRPARGVRAVLHTGAYLILLIVACTVFFASQAGSLMEIVSAQRSEIPQVADLYQDREREPAAADTEQAQAQALSEKVPQVSVEQPSEEIPTVAGPGGKPMEARQPAGQAGESGDREAQNRQRLAAFRTRALGRLKGVRFEPREASGASKPGRMSPSATRHPYLQNQRFRGVYVPGQVQSYPYMHPGYYPQGYLRGGPGTGQSLPYRYPRSGTYAPQQQAASGKVEKEALDAERLIDAVHSDLQGMGDPEQQGRAIAAAVELFGQSAPADPELIRKVERFAEDFLPSDGATALLLSRYKEADSPPAASSTPTVSAPVQPARPPVWMYPWQIPGQRPGGTRPE